MTTLFFNFHDLVGIRIETGDEQAIKFFREEYKSYLTAELSPALPRIDLVFERKNSQKTHGNLTSHTHKFLARWDYKIDFKEKGIEITAFGNGFAIAMIHHMLLHPSLRYLVSLQGVLMLHAGAIVHNGYSWLFTGYGGAGKTTTVSLLLKKLGKGKALHADDYVFISPGEKTFSYLTRAHLYLNLLSWLPELKEKLTAGEKMQLWLLGKTRQWTREGLKWPLRMSLERMWDGYEPVSEAIPAGIIWLERAEEKKSSIAPFTPKSQDVDKLAEMNFYEARHFLALVKKSNAVTDFEGWLTDWKSREKALLMRSVEATPSYLLKISHETQDTLFLDELVQMMIEKK